MGLVLCAANAAAAKPAEHLARPTTDVRTFDESLGELPFGGDVAAVGKWIGKRLDRNWGPRIVQAVDDKERAQLRAQRDKELADIIGNEVVFDGRRTGWESSIIAGEFMAGTSESAYLWRDGPVVHFFFMHEGKLWKYARRLEDSGAPFATRLSDCEGKLGKALAVETESDGEGGKRPVRASWAGAGTDVAVVSRRMLYGGDLFVVQSRAAAAKLETVRAAARAKQGPDEDRTKAIEGVLLPPGSDE